jgi:hypothetical protein
MSMLIRRQVPAFAVLVALLAALTGSAVAQSNGNTIVTGVVTGISPENKAFFLTMPGGREIMVVAGTSMTATTETGSPATFADVRLFDRVMVRGSVIDHNNLTADTIVIVPAVDASGSLVND